MMQLRTLNQLLYKFSVPGSHEGSAASSPAHVQSQDLPLLHEPSIIDWKQIDVCQVQIFQRGLV